MTIKELIPLGDSYHPLDDEEATYIKQSTTDNGAVHERMEDNPRAVSITHLSIEEQNALFAGLEDRGQRFNCYTTTEGGNERRFVILND